MDSGERAGPAAASRPAGWRERLRVVVFEAETPAGKAFDVALLVAIVASVSVVMVLGYSIIAVPTGIVTAEIVESAVAARRASTRA